MKFCPVVPEICRGQVHVPKKERRKRIRIIIIIIIRNGAKTISLPNLINNSYTSSLIQSIFISFKYVIWLNHDPNIVIWIVSWQSGITTPLVLTCHMSNKILIPYISMVTIYILTCNMLTDTITKHETNWSKLTISIFVQHHQGSR